MTDTPQHAHEDLDAGWDTVPTAPASVSISTSPPSAELEQLDAGWEHDHEHSCPPRPGKALGGIPVSGVLPAPARVAHQVVDSIDEGWDTHERAASVGGTSASDADRQSRGVAVPTQLPANPSKKGRRKLERQARAHQAERGSENRAQRKAQRREAAVQRSAEQTAQREALRQQELTRQQQKATRRAEQKKVRPQSELAKPSRTEEAPAKPNQPTASSLNRAARRAKSGRGNVAAEHSAAPPSPSKGKAIGPFALFIAVVLAASALSYLAIR